MTTTERMIAISDRPAPQIIPTLIAQYRKTRSIGSLMAVLKRTIDSAPTIPRETTTLDWIVRMIAVVIRDMHTREILKFLE